MNTTDINKKRNEQMFGCDIEEFKRQVTESFTYRIVGANMVIAGLMSDAQEQIAHGDNEGARQTLNCAKHLLSCVSEGELIGARK
jgi:hypothetical protein